ncbi:MAG: ImmA/IrrE family metallo-endopeptidase [Hyphomicrobiaceae bacterium]
MTEWLSIQEKMKRVHQHQKSWPVDVLAVARSLDLAVYETKDWPDDISGQIKKDDSKPEYVITINGKHSRHRKRFTVAHEIAHYILHQELIGDGIIDDGLYRSRLGGRIEVQANEMAADILMPWELINRAMDLGFNTMEGLADTFDVARSAMAIRLGVPYDQ